MTLPAATGDGLRLEGLDGSNPLAFLAALGVLRTLMLHSEPASRVKMSWRITGVAWTPVVHGSALQDPAGLLDTLDQSLVKEIRLHPLQVLGSKDELGGKLAECMNGCTLKNRDSTIDWLSAVCSDQLPEATSQIQTTRRDYFFGNLKSILLNTQRAHLQRALFAPWDYADSLDNQSLHVEPSEDRRHAYQWHRPSGDPTRKTQGGMLGANRLAIEAFPFFQSIAAGNKLSTRGFSGQRIHNTRWTWPIWSCLLGYEEISSLLALAELQNETPDNPRLRARGIMAAFRCRRILVGKVPNFTSAVAVF